MQKVDKENIVFLHTGQSEYNEVRMGRSYLPIQLHVLSFELMNRFSRNVVLRRYNRLLANLIFINIRFDAPFWNLTPILHGGKMRLYFFIKMKELTLQKIY